MIDIDEIYCHGRKLLVLVLRALKHACIVFAQLAEPALLGQKKFIILFASHSC